MRTRVLAVVLVAAVPCVASGQVRAGYEFQVNTYTTNNQSRPAVAVDPTGRFVVVWRSVDQAPSGQGIYAQRYDAAGVPQGGEFRVNVYTTGSRSNPAIAMDRTGSFVVIWEGSAPDGDSSAILGRRFDAAGLPLADEFHVNRYTTAGQYRPTVAMDAAGNFVVGWASRDQDGSGYGIFAQRYDATGAPRGGEFQVNTYTTSDQYAAAAAVDPVGNFLVVWRSDQDGSANGIFGQRYDATGAPVGGEFQVNSYTTNHQDVPAVAMSPAGDFLVVWQSTGQDGSNPGIYAQRFDRSGTPVGTEFRVNTYTTSGQYTPAVAMDAVGNFVVVWESDQQDTSGLGSFGQRFDAAGTPRGQEFRANTQVIGAQSSPTVGMDSVGNFVVAWASYDQDGSFAGIFGQRYGGLLPAQLTVDARGNGVLEPGETVIVAPSWRSVVGGSLAFTGSASHLTGPAGAVPTLVDASADYGAVADGVTAGCVDCYQVSVSRPATRPATHWDLTVRETIGPAVLGQTKVWTLHVGESFTDVPPTNPFYRFAETLLHVGVTAGCTATTYCPDGVTTREQMAVFLLRAKEGGAYTPPPCTAPPFPDMPCTSPFAAWVQELVARGITAGCGGALYCPTNPVTREQMAVFLLKTDQGASFLPPSCTTASFTDVPCASPFAPWVQELVARAVTAGCGGGLYCPSNPVTRGQMAVFLTKMFGLTLYGP
jgi:hypothetical protein